LALVPVQVTTLETSIAISVWSEARSIRRVVDRLDTLPLPFDADWTPAEMRAAALPYLVSVLAALHDMVSSRGEGGDWEGAPLQYESSSHGCP
jgi:hypothetical protein